MKNTLINYLREEDTKRPRGVVVATKRGDEVFYGYSLHNPIDKWDKELGIKKALARADADEYQLPVVLDRLVEVTDGLQKMEKRALKYFKDIDPENVKFTINEVEEYIND